MTPADLRELVARGESFEREFKGEGNKPLGDAELVEAIVCLANGSGGMLFVGVEDDGRITNVRPRHGPTTDPRRVEALVSNLTRPSLAVTADVVSEGEKLHVLVIDVPKAATPVGTSGGKYLRRALKQDGTPECLPYFVHETLSSSGIADPTSVVVTGARFGDLDPLEMERMRRLARASPGRSDGSLLDLSDLDLCKALGAVEANGTVRAVRRVGLLLFGKDDALRRLQPTHELAWQVLSGTAVEQNEFLHWPLLRAFEELMSRFRARNQSEEIVDLYRTEIPDYSEAGFREALANAMVHRDYSALGAIHVQWTDEGIRVDSPGGLPEGVRLDNLLVTPPRPRNPLLADAFKRAGIVERTGRGIDTIFFEQLRYGRPPPRYDLSTSTSVTVEIPGGDANRALTGLVAQMGREGTPFRMADLLLLQAIRSQGTLNVERAAALAQRDEAFAREVLARLVERGLVESRGERMGRTYHLSAAAFRDLGDPAAYVRTRNFEPLQQEQMVLKCAQEHGGIARREAADLCRLSGPQASRLLAKLAQEHPDELRLEGEKRGARYVWVGPAKRRRRRTRK